MPDFQRQKSRMRFTEKTWQQARKGCLWLLIWPPTEDTIQIIPEFPETLVTSVRNEILYLYDNALEIIAHGLCLHRHIIHSDADLEAYIESDREVMELDIDAVYPTRVKYLYSSIVEFISRAQSEVPSEFAGSIFDLRTAAQNIVQSLKDVKHLRKNMVAYVDSDNDAIRREYNEFRLKIATVLRLIHRLREGDEQVGHCEFDQLPALRLHLEGELGPIVARAQARFGRDGKV